MGRERKTVMRIGDVTRKISRVSDEIVIFHIYQRQDDRYEHFVMTAEEIIDLQTADSRAYPFRAILDSIDCVQGKLILNGSM